MEFFEEWSDFGEEDADDEDDEDDAESYYLGLSKPAWVIIGILTAALGVIGGLIVLVL